MQQTTNYQLPQWEAGDRIRRGDFNGAMSKLDTAIKQNANAISAKAEKSAVTALQSSVAAAAASIGTGGKNCRVALGSYVGNGKYGSDNPNTITCDFYPVLIILSSDTSDAYSYPVFMIRGRTSASTESRSYNNSYKMSMEWLDNGVRYYNYQEALAQCNIESRVYQYIIFGYDKNA